MQRSLRVAAGLAALTLAGIAGAAGSISTPEEHVLRGFFDRQSAPIAASKLALTQGSTEQVRKYAQAELDMYRQLGAGIEGLYKEFTLVTRPNPTGEYRPLEEGKSRGVTELKDGAKYSTVGVIEQLDPNRPPPAPVVRDPKTCQSTTVAGCGPKIAAGIDLSKLSGTDFDNAYLLLTVYGHDAMMRHCTDELLFEQSNPDMVAFAKSAIKTIAKQSSVADGLYRGTAYQARAGGAGGPGGPGGAPRGGAAPSGGTAPGAAGGGAGARPQ